MKIQEIEVVLVLKRNLMRKSIKGFKTQAEKFTEVIQQDKKSYTTPEEQNDYMRGLVIRTLRQQEKWYEGYLVDDKSRRDLLRSIVKTKHQFNLPMSGEDQLKEYEIFKMEENL